jgi:hypothetical protein
VAHAVLKALKDPKRKIMDSSEDKRPALSSPRTEPWGDMSKMTAKELREKLKERGLPSSGSKVEMISRLVSSPAQLQEKLLDTDDEGIFEL